MLPNKFNGYSRDGRRRYYLSLGNDAPAPDYTPMAQASEESARLGAELGHAQLDENKRQYDSNLAITAPLIAKQGAIMDQSMAQADDYYKYQTTQQRPVEEAINAEAMAAGSEAKQAEAANTAVADVRQGSTQSQNQLIRQGLRYGWSPDRMAAMGGTMASGQGLAEASAANGARTTEKNLGFAKKLDAAGLYRGLSGASTAAYGAATTAGAAGANAQLGTSQAYTSGINAGNQTIMGGRQLAQQGLGSILNAQTSVYNSSDGGDVMGGIGSLVGAGVKLWGMSDRRLKDNIVRVGERNGLGLYEFNYRNLPSVRYRGVMADEVEKILPAAVMYGEDGYASVDYGMLGIEMQEV